MQKEMFIANLWLQVSCYSTAAAIDIRQMFYQMFGWQVRLIHFDGI
jgi:hypothetical protein